ncbi:hypothetical protein FQA39_LY04350 [Lamprigera yunnana]|nr:hypothetical protein FQA39_LY04350 [Lamprigera yunnana]
MQRVNSLEKPVAVANVEQGIENNIEYYTNEEELARETDWIVRESRKSKNKNEKFEMKHMEKKQKEGKKRKSEKAKIQAATKTLFAKKKAVKEDYTSLEEEEISLDDSSDDATYWIPEVESSAFEELDRDPEPDDFVLVQLKRKITYFMSEKC